MKAELRTSEAESGVRLAALISNVPGAVYRCAHDAEWTMTLISGEIERISGYPPSDFVASARRTFISVVEPEDRDRVLQEVDDAVAAGVPFSLEYRIVRPDGSFVWVLDRGQLVTEEDGSTWLDGVLFDITERRRAEELARGLHPAVLTDKGLPAAVASLADRAPLPVEVDCRLAERLPAAVEAAAH